MILFLGDSFTWGQGLYFEKWQSEGIDVMEWPFHEYPHEQLDYESHKYRKEHHFPALVAKHFDKDYNIKWGNGGSNWDIIHQANMIPALSPQYKYGIDLVVVQLTDWARDDNRIIYKDDLNKKNSIPNINYLQKHENWENKLFDEMMIDEQMFQLNKLKEIFKKLGLRWIVISWLDDMGNIIKENFKKNYIPFYHKGKEYSSFQLCVRHNEYSLYREFKDDHLNSNGCRLIADSIIKKIESMGGSSLFTNIKPKQNKKK